MTAPAETVPLLPMKISGRKTTTVYRRYRIVDEEDIRDALARTQASLEQQPRSRTVTQIRARAEAGR